MIQAQGQQSFQTVVFFFKQILQFYPDIFAGKAGAYQSRAAYETCNGWLLAMPENIRLEWERLIGANALAYYDTGKILT